MKDRILASVSDLVANLLYYDRKEDFDLPVGAIDRAIRDSEVTVDELVEQFRADLVKGLDS